MNIFNVIIVMRNGNPNKNIPAKVASRQVVITIEVELLTRQAKLLTIIEDKISSVEEPVAACKIKVTSSFKCNDVLLIILVVTKSDLKLLLLALIR